MIRSLRLRLAIGSILSIGIALAVLWVAVGYLFIDYVGQRYRMEMGAIVDVVAARLTIEEGAATIREPPADPRFLTPSGGRYWLVLLPDGQSLRSRSLWDLDIPREGLPLAEPFNFYRISGLDGETILMLRNEITIADGDRRLWPSGSSTSQ